MKTKDNEKYLVFLGLKQGKEPKDLAKECEVSYATVLRWKAEFKTAEADGTLAELLQADEALLNHALDKLKEDVPAELEGEVADLAKGVSGLQALGEDFQRTAKLLNNQIRSHAMRVESASELMDLTKCLTALNDSFFKSTTPQVLVQNNVPGESKYGGFLDDRPKDIPGTVQRTVS